MNPFKALSSVLCIAVLAACNSEPAPEVKAAKSSPPKAAAAKPAPVVAADPAEKMARAVGNGKPGAAVDIRYDILSRPEAGKPVEVEVALIPRAGVEAMDATFSGMDGITLAGNLTASFTDVKPGELYKHRFSLLPQQEGVFYIAVSVSTQMGGSTLGRTFSIPFLVGERQVQEKTSVAAPPVDATGQPIESMPAEESGG